MTDKTIDIKNSDQSGKVSLQDPTINSKSTKKKFLIIALVAIAFIGAVLFFILPSHNTIQILDTAEKKIGVTKYLSTDNLVVNLQSNNGKQVYLKINIQLVFYNDEYYDKAKQLLPSIIDVYISFLRKLRPEDFNTSYSLIKLKSDLLLRTNKILYPVVAEEILFDEILIQS